MLKNYFKIACRNLMKHKVTSFINLFGLTVGLTCCLLILTYIIHECSYDKYNTNANNIYRVTRTFYNGNGVQSLKLSTVAPPFGPLLVNYFPDIKKMTRLIKYGTVPLRYEEKKFNEQDVYMADEHLFDVFTVKLLKGDPHTALTDPFTVILTEENAKKYFGNEDPINKTIRINNQYNLRVTGVYEPFPSNAHIHPNIMISFNTLKDSAIYGERNLQTNWGNNSFFTYLLMPDGYPMDKIESQFPAFLDRNMPSGYYGTQKASKNTSLGLQKLTDIHLYSHTDYEAEENGDIKRVYIFSAIALFILLIACINYMNLSTARSTLRAREIGIRKVSGAQRSEIITQFLSESILVSFISVILALLLTRLCLSWLNSITGQSLQIGTILHWQILLPLALSPLIIGTISGIYPALFMSSFQPVKVLKGLFKAGGGAVSFRKVLVVAQFSISIILIVCTAVVFMQLRYMQAKSLGFNKDHVVTILYTGGLDSTYEAFRNTLLQNAHITAAARSSRIPTGRLLDEDGASVQNGDSLSPVKTDIKYLTTDYDFIPAYGIKMAAGRNFSRSYVRDTSSYILNEAALSAMGFKTAQEAIGKRFSYGSKKGAIIGIVSDFHFESMHQQILPMVFILPTQAGTYNNISVKITGNDVQPAMAHLEKTWRQFMPETPFEYTFLDDKFDKLYKSEQRQGSLFTAFACIAIFIACLGLLGLSAFAISQRIKEIGIRKVLGASVSGIVGLLSKEFLVLVGIASVIAFPIAWYAMHNWLQDFAYRISIEWWIFLLAGIVATAVALITISIHAIRAALANPVKSLRSE